jgi:RNA exonuclease 1
MRLIHPTESIIDTSMVFTHPAGPLMRYSLRNLTKLHLKQFIQDEGFHDSKQDAQATLDLLRFKIALDERTGV